MSWRSPALTRALGAIAAAVFLAGLVAVSVHRDRSHVSTRPAAIAHAGGASDADGDLPAISIPQNFGTLAPRTATTATSSPPTTMAAPITPAPGQAKLPGPVKPTAAGTYIYTETVHGRDGDHATDVTERVANEPGPPGEQRQSVSDSGNDPNSGQSASSHQEVSWTSSGLYLRSEDFSFGGSSYTCTFSTPVQELALPLSVGRQWLLQGTCPITVFGQPITIKINGHGNVSGYARTQVGSDVVDVWVVNTVFDVTGSGAYSFTLHQSATHYIAPAQGLDVAESSTNTSNSPQGSNTFSESRKVHSLHPA
jgi:hypothetical protein